MKERITNIIVVLTYFMLMASLILITLPGDSIVIKSLASSLMTAATLLSFPIMFLAISLERDNAKSMKALVSR